MRTKSRILALSLLVVFLMQGFASVQNVSASTSYMNGVLQEEQTVRAQQQYREEMKIIVGTPDQIDVGDSIYVYAAGLRDAKAAYIKPLTVVITLSHFDESVSQVALPEDARIISVHNGTYDSNTGDWYSADPSRSVERRSDYIYYTYFAPLNQSITVKVTVTMTWISPWHEEMVSTNEKNVFIGEWRDFEKLLETQADDVQGRFSQMDTGTIDISGDVQTISNNVDELEATFGVIEKLTNVCPDPSPLTFYLLNLSAIIDTRVGSNSYVDKLRVTSPAEYANYIARITEVNDAFIDSLPFLDRRGIPYTIVQVNTTYEHTVKAETYDDHLLAGGYYDYDYRDIFGYGLQDADWDNEHLVDCSFEWLLEPNYWTGHPDILHVPWNITVADITADTWYHLQMDGDQTDGAFALTNDLTDAGLVPAQHETTIDLEIYDTYATAYRIETDNSVTELTITINNTSNEFKLNESVTDGYILATPPGGYRPVNRGVIVNLMYDLFPMINRLYAIPQGLADPVPSTAQNEYYISYQNPENIMPPIMHLYMHTQPDGDITTDEIEMPILTGEDAFNISDYVFRWAGMAATYPFFITSLAKPFEKLVYDNNTDSDSYDVVYTETDMINLLTEMYNYDFATNDPEFSFPFFNYFDCFAKVTSDYMGGVIPPSRVIVEQNSFYKNNFGMWIDALFNGTAISPTYVHAREGAWTFRYPDYSVCNPDQIKYAPEFTFGPFVGPSDTVPVGIIQQDSMGIIQNSMDNLTAGFVYSYGMIYTVYYRVYQYTNQLLDFSLQYALQNNKSNSVAQLIADMSGLRQAWIDLDVPTIDLYLQKAIEYIKNPNDEYMAEEGVSQIADRINRLRNSTRTLDSKLADMSTDGKYIDQQVANLPDDVPSQLGLIEQLRQWLNDTVYPIIDRIENKTTQFLTTMQGWVNDSAQVMQNFVKSAQLKANDVVADIAEKTVEFANNSRNAINTAVENSKQPLVDNLNVISSALIVSGLAIGVLGGIAVGTGSVQAGLIGLAVGVMLFALGLGISTLRDNMVGLINEFSAGITGIIDNTYNAIENGISAVRTGVSNAINATALAVNTTIGAVSRAIDKTLGCMISIWRTFMMTIKMVLKQSLVVIAAMNEAITKVISIIGRIVTQLNAIMLRIGSIIQQVGGVIVDIIGKSYNYILDITGDVFTQVKDNLEKTLLENKAFVKVADTLYPMLVKMRRNAGLLSYATIYGEMNQELMLKWVDVFQPASIIQAADTGFYAWQLGSEFAQQLYFLVTLNGTLVDADDVQVTVQRYANFTQEFGIEGSGVLETALPVQQYFDNDTQQSVNGLYYINFFQGENLDWFKENKNGSGQPDFNAPAPEGWYMTVLNASYTDPETANTYTAMWAERTYMYNRKYIEDAFPEIDLVNDGANNQNVINATAGGTPQVLEVEIANQMWSKPYVSLTLLLNSEDGIPISQWEYPEVMLNNEDEDTVKKAVSWSVSRFAPAGDHTLIIAVNEYNGDQTFITARVHVTQETSFVNLLYSWESILLIVGLVAVTIVASYFLYQRQAKKVALTSYLIDIPKSVITTASKKGVPRTCTVSLAKKGICSVPYTDVKSLNLKKWTCDSSRMCKR